MLFVLTVLFLVSLLDVSLFFVVLLLEFLLLTVPFFDSVLEPVFFLVSVFFLSFVSFLAFAFFEVEADFFVEAVFVTVVFAFAVFLVFELVAANKEADIVSPMQKNTVFFI